MDRCKIHFERIQTSSSNRPVRLLTICGDRHSGKSHLANHLLGIMGTDHSDTPLSGNRGSPSSSSSSSVLGDGHLKFHQPVSLSMAAALHGVVVGHSAHLEEEDEEATNTLFQVCVQEGGYGDRSDDMDTARLLPAFVLPGSAIVWLASRSEVGDTLGYSVLKPLFMCICRALRIRSCMASSGSQTSPTARAPMPPASSEPAQQSATSSLPVHSHHSVKDLKASLVVVLRCSSISEFESESRQASVWKSQLFDAEPLTHEGAEARNAMRRVVRSYFSDVNVRVMAPPGTVAEASDQQELLVDCFMLAARQSNRGGLLTPREIVVQSAEASRLITSSSAAESHPVSALTENFRKGSVGATAATRSAQTFLAEDIRKASKATAATILAEQLSSDRRMQKEDVVDAVVCRLEPLLSSVSGATSRSSLKRAMREAAEQEVAAAFAKQQEAEVRAARIRVQQAAASVREGLGAILAVRNAATSATPSARTAS